MKYHEKYSDKYELLFDNKTYIRKGYLPISILWFFILITLLCGCANTKVYSKWQYRAGSIYLYERSFRNCKERVINLATEMIQAGETFWVVYGTYLRSPHVWIELLDGTLIDPSTQYLEYNEFYKEKTRILLSPNSVTNPRCVL